MNHVAVIGLGSNISPKENIAKAKKLLKEKFLILKESNFVKTKPIGAKDINDFINGAILIQTCLDSWELRAFLKDLEKQLGREFNRDPFSSRIIDLDLVVFNNQILDEDFYKRDFLKQATLELLPELKY